MSARTLLLYCCFAVLAMAGERERADSVLNRYQGEGEARMLRGYEKYFFRVERIEVRLGTLDGDKAGNLRRTIKWAEGKEILLKPFLYFRLPKESGARDAHHRYLVRKGDLIRAGNFGENPASHWPLLSVRMAAANGDTVLEYQRHLDQHDACTTSQSSPVDDVWVQAWIGQRISTQREYSIEINITPGTGSAKVGSMDVVLELWVVKQAR